MIYHVKHVTEYQYEFPASLCHNLICQGPCDHPHQKVISFDCEISPPPHTRTLRRDFFENQIIYFSLATTHSELITEINTKVELFRPSWMDVDPLTTPTWETVREWLHTTQAMNDMRQFYLESPHVSFHEEVKKYAQKSFSENRPILDAAMDLCHRIYEDFSFTPGFTEISTPVLTVFDHKKGVCQDYAHFFLSCVRSIGLAARYVSGYIETLPPPGKPKLEGADASHAWISIFIPEVGWVEIDATNNILVHDQHVRAAHGRDFSDVVPLKGIIYSGGRQEMKVKVDVNKVD